jgi:hypothetical protein
MQPLYLVCVFWGVKYREFFLRYCLPSLLAPGNLPLLQSRPGSKLIIATSQDDWAAIDQLPMLREVRSSVEVVLIDIGYPETKASLQIQMHMTKGHKMAGRLMMADGAYGSFLAPDLILTDGTIRRVLELIDSGKKAIFAPALRFQAEATTAILGRRALLNPGMPLVLPPSLAGEIALACLHSELLRFEWTAPHFCDYPISIFRRVGNSGDMVVQTCSWAIVAASYAEVSEYRDDYLDEETVDCHYIYRTFFTRLRKDQIHMVQDSDEMVFFSLTSESDLTFFPLQERPINRVPLFGEAARLGDLRRFIRSDVLDEFRRWAYSLPCHFHAGSIGGEAISVAQQTKDTIRRATAPMGLRERVLARVEQNWYVLKRNWHQSWLYLMVKTRFALGAIRFGMMQRANVLRFIWLHRQTIAQRAYQIGHGDREAIARARLQFRQFARQMLRLQFDEQEPRLQPRTNPGAPELD